MSRQKPSLRAIKIVMVGDSNTGKTCFMKRYIDDLYEEPSVTINSALRTKIVQSKDSTTEIKLEMWDTAGRERYSNLAPTIYREASGFIVCFDLTDRQSFVRANSWLKEISNNAPINSRSILVGTKADLADKRQVSNEEAKEFAQYSGISYLDTSAKLNINIEEAMKVLVSEIEDAGPLKPVITRPLDPTPVSSKSWCTIL